MCLPADTFLFNEQVCFLLIITPYIEAERYFLACKCIMIYMHLFFFMGVAFLQRKGIIAVALVVLLALSAIQINSDRIYEERLESRELSAPGHPVYSIYIDIEVKTLYLLQDNTCIRRYTIATGKSGLPSPLGSWTVVEKGDWGEGFGGRWLGLDVPWGIYGIHGTLRDDSIGTAASHGCIRMLSSDAAELYKMVPLGTRVSIVNGLYGPFGRGFDEIIAGDRGADVLAIQCRLRQLGYYKGELDGIYEDELKDALHRFQRGHKLPADNTVDRKTWEAMDFREIE